MKKKLIAGILALSSVFCLTGCDKVKDKLPDFMKNWFGIEQTAEYDVEGAKAFLQDKYLTKDKEVSEGYDLDTSLVFQGQTYTIAWTIACNVEGVVAIVENEGKVSVEVNSLQLEENVPYTLTATLTAPDKTTATFTLNRVVKAPSQMVPLEITAAPVEGVTYQLYMYQKTAKYHAFFTGKMSDFYLASSDDYTQAANLTVEYVEGSTTNFNISFTDANGKQYLGVEEAWNTAKSYWTFNVVFRETPASSFVWDAELGTFTTTVPCRPASENKNGQSPKEDQTETKTLYLGTYKSYKTFSASTIDNAKNEDTCLAKLVTLVNKNELQPEKKVEREKAALEASLTFNGAVEHTLPKAGTFADVNIAWAVKEGTATIENGVLKIAAPENEADVTLTATLTCGTATDTLDVAVKVYAIPAAITLAEANELGKAQEDSTYTAKKYEVSGTIVEVIPSDKYMNIYIADQTGEVVYVYGLYDADGKTGSAMKTPKVGDAVKLISVVGNYKGAPQLKNATIAEITTPAAVPEFAYAIIAARAIKVEDVTEAGNVTLPTTADGGVTIAWASNNSAIAAVNGGTVTYTLPTSSAVEVTLTATITCGSFSKAYEYKVTVNPATLPTLTVAEANTLGASKEHNTYTSEKYQVSGTVIEAKTSTNNGKTYVNSYIADENGDILYIYGTYTDAEATQAATEIKVGDVVTVVGSLGQYNSAPQMKNGTVTACTTPVAVADYAQAVIVARALSTKTTVTEAGDVTVPVANTTYTGVTIAWTSSNTAVATVNGATITYTLPTEETEITLTATISCGTFSTTKTFKVTVKSATVTNPYPNSLAVFTFGEDEPGVIHDTQNNLVHKDGSTVNAGATFQADYGTGTLTLTATSKVYSGAFDEQGNSCLKFGTSSVVGTMTFTVDASVNKVVIYVAQYKKNTTTVNVGDENISVTVKSNDGQYQAIEIDTSTNKTVTFTTVSGGARAMVNTIVFYAE